MSSNVNNDKNNIKQYKHCKSNMTNDQNRRTHDKTQ